MQALMFPGQGSQKRGMGDELFGKSALFKRLEPQIDGQLGYSLRRMCLDNPEGKLMDTRVTQPCLYVVNALHFYEGYGASSTFDYLAGHSLGEYNALLAADVFDLMIGLEIVKRRGELMADAPAGAMAAVIGLSAQDVVKVLEESSLCELDIANYNSENQIVISGTRADIDRAGPVLDAAGAAHYVPLAVSAAFHSRRMAGAALEFGCFLRQYDFRLPKVPVVSNVTGRLYPSDAPPEAINNLLARQMPSPVRWLDSIELLRGLGVTTFTEVGPGKTLTKLVAGADEASAPPSLSVENA